MPHRDCVRVARLFPLALAGLLSAVLVLGQSGLAQASEKTTTHQTSSPTRKATQAHAAKHKPKHAAPAPKRLAVITSTNVSKADLDALTDAFNEADRRNWPEAMRHADRLTDPVAAKLVLWTRLVTQDSGATLAEITAFQEQNPDWPRQALLTRRAEEALLAYPASDKAMLDWFTAHPPQTGEGKIRFGQTLMAAGRQEEGGSWIRRAWVEDDFTAARQQEILSSYRSVLTPAANRARLDRLLADERTDDAKATAALIGADARALADARIRLMIGSNEAGDALSRVPASLKDDPGLLFDRIRYERRQGNDDDVLPLILTAPGTPHESIDPGAWWIERKIATRNALAEGQYKDAYEIVSHHGLKDGADYADAEFLAGWIALQYLNDAGTALKHFTALDANVSTPISKARAEYWCGRAAAAERDDKVADLYFRRAALYPTTFYGQLAAAELAHGTGEARMHLPRDPQPTAAEKARFARLELVHAVNILHDLDRENQVWIFMLHLADILDTPDQMVELTDLALSFDDPKLSLRVAKTAATRNMVLAQRAYPVSLMPAFSEKGPPVEKPLVYGLSRQESEFDPTVVSSAGARGLMQLMPATARRVARQIDVPYSPHRLTTDAAYNAMLGSAHLGTLIDGYSGSYVMSVAAYNAGTTHVGEWVDEFGDPRSTAVDPVDWIENIPFTETRNYVQRVMENLEVYRSRLSGSERVRLADDIHRNTGAPITTAAPIPGKIPLASPLGLSATMSPVADTDDKGDEVAEAETKPTPMPIEVPKIAAPVVPTPLAPGHGKR